MDTSRIRRTLVAAGAVVAVLAGAPAASGQVLPTVSVVAEPDDASFAADCIGPPSITPGAFVFTRDATTGTLTIPVTVGGDATAGVDYEQIADTVEFADGEGTAIVSVVPLDQLLQLDSAEVKTVSVTIDPGNGFQVGADDTATVEVRLSRIGCDFFEPPIADPAPVPAPTPIAPRFTG